MTAEQVLSELIEAFPDLVDSRVRVSTNPGAVEVFLRELLRKLPRTPRVPSQPRTNVQRVRHWFLTHPDREFMLVDIVVGVTADRRPGEPVLRKDQVYFALNNVDGVRSRGLGSSDRRKVYVYAPVEHPVSG